MEEMKRAQSRFFGSPGIRVTVKKKTPLYCFLFFSFLLLVLFSASSFFFI